MSSAPDAKKRSHASLIVGLAGVTLALALGAAWLKREALFRWAVESQQWGAAKVLLAADPGLANSDAFKDSNGYRPLRAAIAALPLGSDEAGFAKALLERGADPDAGDPIDFAASRNNKGVVELLLAHGADPGRGFAGACIWPDCEALDLLLDAGADPSNEPWALGAAISCDNKRAVETLLKRGADVWANDPFIRKLASPPPPGKPPAVGPEIVRMIEEAAAKNPSAPRREPSAAKPRRYPSGRIYDLNGF